MKLNSQVLSGKIDSKIKDKLKIIEDYKLILSKTQKPNN